MQDGRIACACLFMFINPKESLHLKQAKDYSLILGVFYKHKLEGILMKYVHE